MITIHHSQLAGSAVRREQYPTPVLPEICLLGRSNSGKSSLINTLLQRKNLARTSSQPGKTRLINFYQATSSLLHDQDKQVVHWYFVDLPGYGYAHAAKSERAAWMRFIDQYLSDTSRYRLCWQLVDIRHQPSAQDLLVHDLLREAGLQPLTIANKLDKISRNQRVKQQKIIRQALSLADEELLCFSAISGEGKEALLERIESFLLASPLTPTNTPR